MVLLNLVVDDVKQATAAVFFDSTASTVGGDFVKEVCVTFLRWAFWVGRRCVLSVGGAGGSVVDIWSWGWYQGRRGRRWLGGLGRGQGLH